MKKIILILVLLITTISFSQQRARIEDGKIKVYNQLPKKLITPNGTVWNFRSADSITVYSYGFRDVLSVIVGMYEHRDTIYMDVEDDVFKYSVRPFTQEEIDRYDESQLNNDVSAIKERKYENDGQQLYRKIKNRIRRKLDNSTITQIQFDAIRRTLRPAIIPLTTGDWDIVQENLNAITPPTNAKLLEILNNIKGFVNDYITNNY